jgi:hypothetical protein
MYILHVILVCVVDFPIEFLSHYISLRYFCTEMAEFCISEVRTSIDLNM